MDINFIPFYILNVSCVPPFGYLYFLSFRKWWTKIGYINWPGMALTLIPSWVGWVEIWTHDLLIMNLVCYPLDQPFALYSYLYNVLAFSIHNQSKYYNEFHNRNYRSGTQCMASVYSIWEGNLCNNALTFNVICEFAEVGLSSIGMFFCTKGPFNHSVSSCIYPISL